MPRRHSFNVKHVLLLFLLIFSVSRKHGAAQVNREEAKQPPGETQPSDGHGGDGGAFFALRSCHQQLHGDSGEFFSPDYLCSNPSLWCNWTIQVDPGKRIHLHLEDLTPDDACHLKQDEIHVDDPAARSGGHRVLQRCWREAKYTSSSSVLEVVLLISGWPHLPYRGFYGRYQVFGPPVIYNPQEEFSVRDRKSEPHPGLMDFSDFGPVVNSAEQMESDLSAHPSAGNSDVMFDDYDQPSDMMAELLWEPEENADPESGENLHLASGNHTRVYPFLAVPTVPASTQGTSRSGRGVAPLPSSLSDSALDPERRNHTPTAIQWDIQEAADGPGDERGTTTRSKEEEPATGSGKTGSDGKNRTETSDQHPSTSEGPELRETEQAHPHPNMMEPLSDHRGNHHLFEAAVEVNFIQDLEESWDNQARSLLLSVKALISEQLEALHTPLSMSSKRIKRLNAGVLYILWLQIGQGPRSPQVHRSVHAAMQGLIAASVGLHTKAVIVSVSTADVNECGTQLVLCDVNADCVNHFGSYSCHCRPDFLDQSRLGSGGTVCVDVKASGCSSGLSAETKGVYVLFFLLSSLILMLLVAAGTLYHHHHRGMFLVRCHSNSSVASPPDPNNNHHHHHDGYSIPPDSDLGPPPPPARGPREGWAQVKECCPAVDLPLLRFSPLLPPDGYMEPRDGGKK